MEITFFTFQAYASHTTLIHQSRNHPHKERVMMVLMSKSHLHQSTDDGKQEFSMFYVGRKTSRSSFFYVPYKLEWISFDVILPLGIFIYVAPEKLSWWGLGKLFMLD